MASQKRDRFGRWGRYGSLASGIILPALLLTAPVFAFDSDSDALSDEADAFPCDAKGASVAFAPAQGAHGMLLFEDQWPDWSDLDFNDAVLSYNYIFELDAQGAVRAMRANFNLLALGGVFNNGLGLQLPVPTSAVASVRQTVKGSPAQTLTPQAAESNLTLRLLPNMRALFGNKAGPINSDPALGTDQGLPLEVEIVFSTPQVIDLGQAPFDVFIFRSDSVSHEIHRPQFSGTAAMNRALFGTGLDGSSTSRHFVDTQGLPFALTLPDLRPWTQEGVGIYHLYPNITTFAASGGAESQDFYAQGVDLQFAYGWTPPVDNPQAPTVGGPWLSPVTPGFVGADSIPADTACINAWGLSVEFGTTRDTYGYASALDGSGNVVITGYTNASVSGSPNAGAQDIFVAKYNRNTGAIVWAKQFGGSGSEAGRAIAIDASGNIYVSGETRSSFGGQTNAGQSDAFLLKLGSDGALQWTRFLGAAGTDRAHGLAIDSTGTAIYIGGGSTSTTLPGASYSNSSPSSFLARYDASGNRQWVQQYRTDALHQDNSSYTTALAVDSSGAVYAAGAERRYNQSASAASNPYLVKHDGATGQLQWTRHIGDYGYYTGSADYRFGTAFGVAVASTGQVYVAGNWQAGSAVSQWNGLVRTAGDSSADMLLVAYNTSGDYQWGQSLGSTDAKGDFALNVTADAAGNAYCVGYTGGALPGQTAGGNYDYFAARFSPSGTRQWVVQHNTSNDDGAFGAHVDAASSSLYVVGNTGQISGNPISLANQYYGFIARLGLGNGAQDLFNLTANIIPTQNSCATILASTPGASSGVYTVDPDGAGPIGPFDVYCDMTNDGGGWTLVMRGLAPQHTNWSTTGDLNVAYARSVGNTFKFSDAKINSLRGPGGIYRIMGDGRFVTKRFVDSSCVYDHQATIPSSGGCSRSYASPSWTDPVQSTSINYSWHKGFSDFDYSHGRYYFLLYHGSFNDWCVGPNGGWCYGSDGGSCNFSMWVR